MKTTDYNYKSFSRELDWRCSSGRVEKLAGRCYRCARGRLKKVERTRQVGVKKKGD